MQAPLLLQPPPLLAIAQKNITRPRVPQHFSFDDLSSLIDLPQPMTVENDHDYPSQSGTNYTYAPRPQFDDAHSALNHNLYDASSSSSSSQTPQPFNSLPNFSQPSNYALVSHARNSDGTSPDNSASRYVSGSPSPVDDHPTTSFPQPYSAPHHQDHFPSSVTSYPPDMGITSNLSTRGTDKYAHALLDQRRMSEPAMFGSAIGSYSTSSSADLASARYQQLQHQYTPSYTSPRLYGSYPSSLQRTLSTGSVRDHLSGSSWRDQDQIPLHSYNSAELEEPISPLNPNFSGGESSPTMGFLGMPYGNVSDDYGPSPPGTGTSTSSNTPGIRRFVDASGSNTDNKQYSFVALPGNAVKKRPRRRYDEIERLYQCSWPSCAKAYGTLNHLNAHVTMQKHGPKRSPNEFKELRKQWRKSKKEEADARAAAMARSTHHPYLQRHDSYPEMEYRLRSHSQQGAHDQFTPPAGSPEDMHEIDMQDVYERRQQRFSGLFPPASRTSSPSYTTIHQPTMSSPHSVMNRVSTNTLLPGYEHTGGSADLDVYASYGVYGANRPGSGHGSLGSYDEKRRSSLYDDKQS
ncbi:hypothetical protein AZE42_01152 [Rhizopogon vesiculosus]|uniref:C2H2-type domain-containing protein n=1 Tax=Rhizopogon vesiculosus TaxID=180088 RepID=A0A1J8Q7B9_9AGAM|nr:hypothetical protein AZE42_01152 [Rhizopogon vesiculosus]